MLVVENEDIYGWDAAVRGMRNPLNSWEKSDSHKQWVGMPYDLGDNDLNLMQRLIKAGTDHRKFLRMISVSMDIVAPLYWWKEFDTYKVGTVANSCSTMHKIHAKEFELDDFSHDYLEPVQAPDGGEWINFQAPLNKTISALNELRHYYNETKDKKYWNQMIQLLPSSYNQRRTVTLNYEVLRNMYFSRRFHKLAEWHTFCEWIETLPYAKDLICIDFQSSEIVD